eukprot:scaffold406378_cov67-Attheya_sp.AAC.1
MVAIDDMDDMYDGRSVHHCVPVLWMCMAADDCSRQGSYIVSRGAQSMRLVLLVGTLVFSLQSETFLQSYPLFCAKFIESIWIWMGSVDAAGLIYLAHV